MRVVLDHCTPRPFGRLLRGHEVRTSQQMGWSRLRNGLLMATAAEAGFGALVTVDGNLSFQQNKGELPIPVIAMVAPDNKPATLAPLAPDVLKILNSGPQKRVYVVGKR